MGSGILRSDKNFHKNGEPSGTGGFKGSKGLWKRVARAEADEKTGKRRPIIM